MDTGCIVTVTFTPAYTVYKFLAGNFWFEIRLLDGNLIEEAENEEIEKITSGYNRGNFTSRSNSNNSKIQAVSALTDI